MKKIMLLAALSILATDSQASQADPSDKDLYLVVGSTRQVRETDALLTRIIGEGIDFSHRKTFGGKAITMSEAPCHLEGMPHIMVNPRTFKPLPGQVIRAMFFELLPSIAGENDDDKIGAKGEYLTNPEASINKMLNMSGVIKNLSTYAVQDATLEIEHWPHGSVGFSPDFYIKTAPHLRKMNPFGCFISPYFPDFIMARNLGDMDHMLYWKKRKQELLANDENQDLVDYSIWEATFFQNRATLRQAVQNLCSAMQMSNEELEARLSAEYKVYVEEAMNFYRNSINAISLHIMQEYSVLTQLDHMKSLIEKLGYENVLFEKRDNPLNGRKNSWMITAVKSTNTLPTGWVD